jgi:methoxymalonate biosynthesis acyl carrier protein
MSAVEKIREYIASNISTPLSDDSDFFELGLVDSLFALQLVAFVEQEFGFVIEPHDLDIAHFCSIDALDKFVTLKAG